MKRILQIVILLLLSSLGYTQTRFVTHNSPKVKILLQENKTRSDGMFKGYLRKLSTNNIQFLGAYLKRKDNEGYENYLDSSEVSPDLSNVDIVGYEYLYSFGKIGYLFNIKVDMKTDLLYFQNDDGIIIGLLDSLSKGFHKECIDNLMSYIAKNKIKAYYAYPILVKINAPLFSEKFLWKIIKTDENLSDYHHFFQGGHGKTVSPKTGKEDFKIETKFSAPKLIQE